MSLLVRILKTILPPEQEQPDTPDRPQDYAGLISKTHPVPANYGQEAEHLGEECKKGHIASNNMLVIPFFCVSIMAVAISEQQEKTVSVSFLLYLLYNTFLCLLPYFQTD